MTKRIYLLCMLIAYLIQAPQSAVASSKTDYSKDFVNSFATGTANRANSITENVITILIASVLIEPIKSVMDKFTKTMWHPRIDAYANKSIPPFLYETAPEGHTNTNRVNDLILNKETHVQINTFLLALKDADRRTDPLPSLLLYGPPGTGKTEIAKRLANEGQFILKSFSGAELTTVNPVQLKHLFQWVAKPRPDGKKVIIFIDEVENLLKANAFGVRHNALQIFLAANGDRSQWYTFVVVTNNIEDIDRAAFRRFNNPIEVPLPARIERLKIIAFYFKKHFSKHPKLSLEGDFLTVPKDKPFRKQLMDEFEGLSGSDIMVITQNCASEAMLMNDDLITKEMVIRHARDKKNQYSDLSKKREEAEKKRVEEEKYRYNIENRERKGKGKDDEDEY